MPSKISKLHKDATHPTLQPITTRKRTIAEMMVAEIREDLKRNHKETYK